jgi:hypothetical protein
VDLYHLVEPLHNVGDLPLPLSPVSSRPLARAQHHHHDHKPPHNPSHSAPTLRRTKPTNKGISPSRQAEPSSSSRAPSRLSLSRNPVILPINGYGTFTQHTEHDVEGQGDGGSLYASDVESSERSGSHEGEC